VPLGEAVAFCQDANVRWIAPRRKRPQKLVAPIMTKSRRQGWPSCVWGRGEDVGATVGMAREATT